MNEKGDHRAGRTTGAERAQEASMVRINAVSSVMAAHEVGIEQVGVFLCAHAPEGAHVRLRHALAASGNRTRSLVLPLDELARLDGAGQRGNLYREHAAMLGERALAGLAELDALRPDSISTVVFVSSTGWAAPSIDTHLVRRFGLNPRCRRIPLAQLGCGGGVAALSLAAEVVRRDPGERVLVVSAEVPSLQLQLAEPSYPEMLAAAHFGDGAAAAIVSSDDGGPEVVGTQSVLLPEIKEGGRIVASETGLRLVASGGLPRLIRSRVRELVEGCANAHHVEARELSFLVAHPRGSGVLDAVAEGLSVGRSRLAASWAAWERSGNMVSASIYRALAELARCEPPESGALGMLLAFGTGVACEMTLVRWRSAPDVFCS
jgi:alkylresorcinol/alkylpyrone synthase